MLIALADFYEKEVYTPRLVQNETGAQVEHVGFACAITKELKKELLALAERKEIAQEDIERAFELTEYREELEKWAELVKDSDEDAYLEEVREAHKGRRLKWVLNMSPTVLQQHEQLLCPQPVVAAAQPFATGVATPPPLAGAMPPPIMQQPQYQYHLALNGQNFGPYPLATVLDMLRSQQINATTQVWREGLPNWITVAQCPELAILPPPIMPSIPPVLQ